MASRFGLVPLGRVGSSLRIWVAIVLLAASLVAVGSPAIAQQPGDLDPTFGTNGEVLVANRCGEFRNLLVRSDGRIVAGGIEQDGGNYPGNPGSIHRFLTDGSVDSGFGGGDGEVWLEDIFGGNTNPQIAQLAEQPGGRSVAAGRLYGGTSQAFILRLLNDGTPDTTFDADGVVGDTLGGVQVTAWSGVASLATGGVVVAGLTTDSKLLLAQLDDTGTLDTSFGNQGLVLSLSVTAVRHLVRQANGNLITAGSIGGDIFVARFLPTGAPDPTFGTNGVYTAHSRVATASDFGVMTDGRIAVTGCENDGTPCGSSPRDQFVALVLTASGTPDPSFGTNGVGAGGAYSGEASSTDVQANGKVVIGGGGAVVRLDANGNLDPTFGTTGAVSIGAWAWSTQVQPDGKILIAGGDQLSTTGSCRVQRRLGDPVQVCGNGVIEPPEECDDSNLVSGDGCSSTCLSELGGGCTPTDLTTKDAEKCLGTYASALRKCVAKSLPFDTCDTSKSAPYCSRLSASCTPRQEVDLIFATVYGGSPTRSKCLATMVKEAVNLASQRYKRQRAHASHRLAGDFARCLAKTTNACGQTPQLSGLCATANTPFDAASCVCEQVSACRSMSTAEFQDVGVGRWNTTKIHAASLGYTEVVSAEECRSVAGATTVTARLRIPAQPDQTLTLAYSTDSESSFLIRLGADGFPTLFNEGGGLTLRPLSDGGPLVVDPTGMPASARMTRVARAGNGSCDLGDYLICKYAQVESITTKARYASCIGALLGGAACYYTGVGCGLAYYAMGLGAVCTSSVLEALPDAECENLSSEHMLCDSDTMCAQGRCHYGSCQRAEPLDESADCTAELGLFTPRCTGIFGGELHDGSARCHNGECRLNVVGQCRECEVCRGDGCVQFKSCPCPDGFCNGGETCATCPQDCGACPPGCPDGACNGTETCSTCPQDCGTCPPGCGDGSCNGSETRCSCPADCGVDTCGNGTCCAGAGESTATCPADCGSRCGDGACNGAETRCNCPADCGAETCGNGVCCAAAGENSGTCPSDCGSPFCGDGSCNGSETRCSCPADCGVDTCGNGTCCAGAGESTATCPADCGSRCGDGACNGAETRCNCPADCGAETCGNGVCCAAAGENSGTCPSDCGSSTFSLTTAVSPGGTGSTSPSCPSGCGYSSGLVVNVSTSPTSPSSSTSQSYRFVGWSGDASGTANPVAVTMNSNKSVTAGYVCKETEPNDTSPFATAVPHGAPCSGVTSGVLSSTSDFDWFDEGQTVPSGVAISFYLYPPSDADYDLELYGPDPVCGGAPQCLLASSSNIGNGLTESVSFSTRATGYFAARVVRYRGATSSSYYSLLYLR